MLVGFVGQHLGHQPGEHGGGGRDCAGAVAAIRSVDLGDDRGGPDAGHVDRRRDLQSRRTGNQHDRQPLRRSRGRLRGTRRAGAVSPTGRRNRGILADQPVGGSAGTCRRTVDRRGRSCRRIAAVSMSICSKQWCRWFRCCC